MRIIDLSDSSAHNLPNLLPVYNNIVVGEAKKAMLSGRGEVHIYINAIRTSPALANIDNQTGVDRDYSYSASYRGFRPTYLGMHMDNFTSGERMSLAEYEEQMRGEIQWMRDRGFKGIILHYQGRDMRAKKNETALHSG